VPELSAEYYKGINPGRTKQTLSTFSKADAKIASHFISTSQAQSGIKLARVTGIMDGLVAWKKLVDKPFRDLDIEDVHEGVNKIREKYAINTAIQYISTMKAFLNWMIETKLSRLDTIAIDKIKLPKPNKMSFGPGDILSEEDITILIQSCTTPRDKAILAMMYDGGFRAVDLALMTWADLDFELSQERITAQTDAKTGVPRKVSLATCKEYVIDWRNHYPGAARGNAPVFVTMHGAPRPMKYSTLLSIIRRVRDEAHRRGVSAEKGLGLHQFRRASITHEANKGRPIAHVCMEKWGKAYSPMIDRYVKPSDEDIANSKMEMLGIEKRKYVKRKTAMMPTQCPECGFVNSPGIEYCGKCGHGLTEDAQQGMNKFRQARQDPALLREYADWLEKRESGQT